MFLPNIYFFLRKPSPSSLEPKCNSNLRHVNSTASWSRFYCALLKLLVTERYKETSTSFLDDCCSSPMDAATIIILVIGDNKGVCTLVLHFPPKWSTYFYHYTAMQNTYVARFVR